MKYQCQITHEFGRTLGSVENFNTIGRGFEISMKWFLVEEGKMFKLGDPVYVQLFLPAYKYTDIFGVTSEYPEENFMDWSGAISSISYEGNVFVIRGVLDV